MSGLGLCFRKRSPSLSLHAGIQASTVTDQDYKPKPESFLYKKNNLLL